MPGMHGEMTRSSSTPSRGRRFRVTRPPDSWAKDWQTLPTGYSGPRWTSGKEGFQSSVDRAYNSHYDSGFKEQKPSQENKPRFRDTWIQKHMRQNQWTPGPGTYRTNREFMLSDKDDLDSNLTVQEKSPDFSFQKSVKETSKQIKDVKPQKNNPQYPKLTPDFTPGPGAYLAYTGFGAPSGGHNTQYLGGRPSKISDTPGASIAFDTWRG
eukprot:TRINITY_DN124900_c0_g1_i1.p1 TRINITY_DN124900_c0_g1~~TRINITY_DN124900_c0_g1_i1.p1  ORF type:complete len:210 (+),score=31.83 TRINITY_DN124900_c0_g1_i1:155-784(+)